MQSFNYYAPTQVVFGPDSEQETGKLVKKYGGTKVLVHYGGGSVVRSGMFDVSHGAGLAALWGSWARYVLNENPTRFARFAVNVLGVQNDFNDTIGTALRGIEKMEEFYRSIGMPTNIKELIGKDITDAEIEEMADKCSNYGSSTVGALKVLKREDMVNIYKMAR